MRFDRLSGGEKVIVEIYGGIVGRGILDSEGVLIDAFDSTYASRRNRWWPVIND